jgi:hypothetical protein
LSQEITVSEALQELTILGIDHGIESIRDGGPLVPFVIVEQGGVRRLQRCLAGQPDAMDLEGSVMAAVGVAREAMATPDARVVLVYDAYLRSEGERFDAVYAEAAEGGAVAAVIAQRYRPKARFRGLDTIGNLAGLPPTFGHLGEAG